MFIAQQETRSFKIKVGLPQVNNYCRSTVAEWTCKEVHFRKKIIKNTINNVLTQQAISKASFFYRMKKLVVL